MVHPHARGEHARRARARDDVQGSSPRPWGTRCNGNDRKANSRFIPTPVGNTGSPIKRIGECSVHPHARGEHDLSTFLHETGHGSSPRPWGTRVIQNSNGRYFAVHPHARGEHPVGGRSIQITYGSSPRPWGTPEALLVSILEARFIPTPVGNTCRSHSSAAGIKVHPHARGEHVDTWSDVYADMRFIPTPVGNTLLM